MKYKRGYIKDKPNDQIKRPSTIQSINLFGIPPVFDMQKFCSPIKNQGNEGTCTAFSYCKYYETLYNKKYKKIIDLSERHIYQQALLADEYEGDNYEGTSLFAVLNSAKCYGTCPEEDWVYEATVQGMPANKYHMEHGLNNCIKEFYWAINDFNEIHDLKAIKKAIYNYSGLYCAFNLIDGFENYENGIIKNGKVAEEDGHAMTVVGYDDNKQAFHVANSWGSDWGEGGYCWIGYSIFQSMLLHGFGIKI